MLSLDLPPLLPEALLAAVLVSLASGLSGTFVLVRGMSLLAGAIAHAALGGIGVAHALGQDPLHGALVAAVLTAVCAWWLRRHAGEAEDVMLGALWSTGMAIGVIAVASTPGYGVDLADYLFGSLLTVSVADLWLMAGLDLVLLLLFATHFREFAAISFDTGFAELRGLPVARLELLLLVVLALTAVLLARVVGLVLVVALLALPAAIARRFTDRLLTMSVLACVVAGLCTTLGIGVSWQFDWPSGASVVLVAVCLYLLALARPGASPTR
jgi:zinc transport system permease protein